MSLFTQASVRTKSSDCFRWVTRRLPTGTVASKVNMLLGVAAMLLVVSGLASTGGSQAQEPGDRRGFEF
jgi:hypothetical protein